MMRKCFLANDMQIEARNGLNSPFDLDPKIWLIFDQKLELGCQVNGSLLYGCFNACHVFASLKMRSAAGLQEFSDAKWVEWCWDGSVEWHGVDYVPLDFCSWSCLPTNSWTGYNSAISACSKAWGLNPKPHFDTFCIILYLSKVFEK